MVNRLRLWIVWFALIAVLAPAALWTGCSVADPDEDEDDTVTVGIRVLRDEFFDLAEDEVIGQAKFNKHEGQVGVRVKSKVLIETLSRFPDQKIDVRLELQNQDAARDDWAPVTWVQDTNVENIDFFVPLVETIPTLLNFRLLVYYYTYEDEQALKADDATDDDDDDDDNDDDDNDDDDNDDDDNDDDDATDDDATDDDAADDDATDDDTAPEPDRVFEAEAIFTFLVNRGQPGTGD